MTARSTWRGHNIKCEPDGEWYYSDTNEPVANNQCRVCRYCNRPNRDDDHDACLGELEGVDNACCGHGNPDDSYIRFSNGVTVRGFIVTKD